MNIDILVQARLGSRRFPRKVLAEVAGVPLIRYLLDGMKRATQARHVVALVPYTDKELISAVFPFPVWVGDEHDVAGRFVDYCERSDCDGFVRVCGDSPVLDWRIVNDMICIFRETSAFLVSNVDGGFPAGQHCEVVDRRFFLRWKYKLDREHVTPTLYAVAGSLLWPWSTEAPSEKPSMTVDCPDDLVRMARVIERADFKPWERRWRENQCFA